MKIWTGAAVLVFWGAAAGAASVPHFTSAWFLGDSLSDPGNVFAATGGALPPDPPYFQGRFSNGPVWAEHVAAPFEARGLPTGNFAHGFANALPNDDVARGRPAQFPDLPDQVAAFGAASAGRLGARPAAALWFGANDIFGEIDTAAAPDTARVGRRAARAVGRGLRAMARRGVRDFYVFNLPPLEALPNYQLFEPQNADHARIGANSFNRKLDKVIGRLDAKKKLNVTKIDMSRSFSELIANPKRFGLADAVRPCVIPGVSVCTAEESLERAFFDPVHPNRVVHAAIGDIAGSQIAPVPLPAPFALLAAGMAALVGFGLRGQRQSSVRRNRARATAA